MNTNTMELNLNEMELVNGGISEPEAMFMITMGTTSGAIVGGFIGSGIPVAGTVVGAALGGAFGFIGSGIGVAIRYLVED